MRSVNIEVTVKSIVYMRDYDRYAVDVIFPYETKVTPATLQPIHLPDSIPNDIKSMVQSILTATTPQPKINFDTLSGTIYLTEDDYNALSRFGVGSKLQLVIDIGAFGVKNIG